MTGAVAAFRRAIELKPDFEKARYNLGIALRAQGETAAAQKQLKELEELHQFRARLAQSKLLILQGVDALKQEKLDDALALFQKSVEQSPELPTGTLLSRRNLGTQQDDPTCARGAIKKQWSSNRIMPRPTPASELYWAQDNHAGALEEFRQAVMSDPDLAEAHYNLGLALAKSERLDESIRELNEAISLDPKYTDARIQLGLVLSQNNDPAGATNVFRDLISRDPNFAEAHNNLGLVFLQAGDLAAAHGVWPSGGPQAWFCGGPLQPRVSPATGRKTDGSKRGVREGVRDCAGVEECAAPQTGAPIHGTVVFMTLCLPDEWQNAFLAHGSNHQLLTLRVHHLVCGRDLPIVVITMRP